jgi:hypothetical protein
MRFLSLTGCRWPQYATDISKELLSFAIEEFWKMMFKLKFQLNHVMVILGFENLEPEVMGPTYHMWKSVFLCEYIGK